MKNVPVFLLLMAVALNGLPGTDLLVLCLGSDGHLDVHDLSTHETEEGCCEHETGCSYPRIRTSRKESWKTRWNWANSWPRQ